MVTPSGFDRIARIYRWAEYATLGPFLARTRNAHLDELAHTQHALILGDGDGRFTAHALRIHPHLHVTAIDISAAMLALLRKRCAPYANRLQTIQADITTAPINAITTESSFRPESSRDKRDDVAEKSAVAMLATRALSHESAPPPDAIVTHFFLDCLTTQQIETLATQLTTPTRWIVSDFDIPATPLKLPARIFIRSLYLAFRILTGLQTQQLPQWRQALLHTGWTQEATSTHLKGLLVSEVWQRHATIRTHRAS